MAVKPIEEWHAIISTKTNTQSHNSILLAIEYAENGIQFSNWWLYGPKGH
jgi:hypothetical protein